ncbi:MAG: sensor histidine kinase [Chthoniobacterales bacterium]
MREIAYGLRPYLLDRLGLTKALPSRLKKVSAQNASPLEIDIESIDGRFAPEAEMSIYRILQESVNNVVKHSGATRATVRVVALDESIHISIEDNGHGFDVSAGTRGFGLLGLAERVRLLNGTHTARIDFGTGDHHFDSPSVSPWSEP